MIAPPDGEYAQFKQAVAALLPVRLDYYKQQQMERRIRDLARKHSAPSLQSFVTMLRADPALLRELERHITINVSEFFRNPEAFEYLDRQVLPRLLAARRGLRLWSAGCSYGAEAFTLAMLLREAAPALLHAIYATDIDRSMLERARMGRGYTRDDVHNVPPRLRRRYIVGDAPPYAVSADILRLVRFDRHDMLEAPVARTFDLIACRNVVIYFTDEAKKALYQKLVAALHPGGYLFIGATEIIGEATRLGLRYVAPCFYEKAER